VAVGPATVLVSSLPPQPKSTKLAKQAALKVSQVGGLCIGLSACSCAEFMVDFNCLDPIILVRSCLAKWFRVFAAA